MLHLRPSPSGLRRLFSTAAPARHDNPLGLPRREARPAPTLPRRGGPPQKRGIPNVRRVLAVASGKGGVGKSTTAVNIALALGMARPGARVGVLDLDVFGPSIPRLMGLASADEPLLTDAGALVPLTNHSMPCMSMGFLLPKPALAESQSGSQTDDNDDGRQDAPVVWRGLMVQKAVQQLLFDVDWRAGAASGSPGAGLDILVVDMPPGTGDVPLTFGQLVNVDGAVIVSTPQSVALDDVRKGVSTFRKLSVPITGVLLNTAHTYCPSCSAPHALFGPPDAFTRAAERMRVHVLGALPLVPGVATAADAGVPYALWRRSGGAQEPGADEWRRVMQDVAAQVWSALDGAD